MHMMDDQCHNLILIFFICSVRVAQLDKPFASVSEAQVRFPAGVFGKKLGQLSHTTLPL